MKNLDAFDNTLQSVRGNFKMSIYMLEKPAHIHAAFFCRKFLFFRSLSRKAVEKTKSTKTFL